MSTFGRQLYGDPCSGCGFSWSTPEAGAGAMVVGSPERFRSLLHGADGSERTDTMAWSVSSYVWHVADNICIWAERLAALALDAHLAVAGYDQDEMAEARGYARLPLGAGLWALEQATRQWTAAWELVVDRPGTILRHPVMGKMSAGDVLRQVAHDVVHHQWDVERAMALSGRP